MSKAIGDRFTSGAPVDAAIVHCVVPGAPEKVTFRTNILRGGIDYAFY